MCVWTIAQTVAEVRVSSQPCYRYADPLDHVEYVCFGDQCVLGLSGFMLTVIMCMTTNLNFSMSCSHYLHTPLLSPPTATRCPLTAMTGWWTAADDKCDTS